jgi:hypothetical protein
MNSNQEDTTMMNEKQVPIEDLRAAVKETLYTVSGAYCSEFWDGMREVCDDLDNVKAIKKTIELLHASGHDKEAFQFILAQYDLIALEIPEAIREIEPYEEATSIFIAEFIEDSIDLMYDYEAEEEGTAPAWN